MKVKIFQAEKIESLEGEINHWLNDNPDITFMGYHQSESGDEEWSIVTVSILYHDHGTVVPF